MAESIVIPFRKKENATYDHGRDHERELAIQIGIQIRAYLASVKPLRGCRWCDNAAFHAGRTAIEQLAMAYLSGDDTLDPTLAQCADMLEYLSSVEPVDPRIDYASGGVETCGWIAVLKYVQTSMREVSHG
ncbi:MAG: hypothetical protein ABW034_05605 [Steroidobacteraceae bacterium]